MIAAILTLCGATVLTACSSNEDNGGTMDDGKARKALLVILDGWGIGDKGQDDAIAQTATPYMDYLKANYPNTELQASGGYVGLPDGQMGNSETGHLNIGAGRIVYQDLVKINRACADNSILENPEIKAAYSYAKASGKNLHLMGLTSTGGVHSSLDHLLKLLDIAKEYNIQNCYVHCFMDGRDTDPYSGKGFIADVQRHMDETGAGSIASVIGRYYAMDRDKHWDRIKLAYDLIVNGKGREVDDMVEGVQSCYDSHTEEHKNTDEFMEPLVNGNIDGRIREGDVVIFFNFRSDRAKELTTVLTQQDMPEQGMTTIANLQYYCMTPYDDSFTGVHILFPKDNLENTLGEYIASKGLKQLHIAETEKYAHVTSFINGGREEPFPGEDRILVASPQVATYDLKPEMSAFEVKDKLVEALKTDRYDSRRGAEDRPLRLDCGELRQRRHGGSHGRLYCHPDRREDHRPVPERGRGDGQDDGLRRHHHRRPRQCRPCRQCRWHAQHGTLHEPRPLHLRDREQERDGAERHPGRRGSLHPPHHGPAAAQGNDRPVPD